MTKVARQLSEPPKSPSRCVVRVVQFKRCCRLSRYGWLWCVGVAGGKADAAMGLSQVPAIN